MDTDSFVIHIKTDDFYKDIVDDVEKWFDTSNYSEDDGKQLPIRIKKKKSFFFKDGFQGKVMKEFAALRLKTYS